VATIALSPATRLRRLAFLFLGVAAACSAKPGGPAAVSADAVAVVDGREIKKDDLEKAYRRATDPASTPLADEVLTTKITILNDLIMQDLLLAKAKALKIEATGAEIEAAFADRKKSMPADAFATQLATRHLTEADVKETIRRELTAQKVIDHEVTAKISVSDAAIADYFTAHRAEFNLAEPGYRVAQIVITPVRDEQITNRQNDDATTPEAAARKVKMITDKLKAGAHFSDLAMDYSEDPQSAPQGGVLGLITASQLQQAPAAVRTAVLKAEPGQINQVSIGGGYSLVLLIAKEPPGQRTLGSPGVRDNIVSTLREREQELLQLAFVTAVRNDATVMNLLAKQVADRPGPPPSAVPMPPGNKK
jgi:peptidyl-prolyl cis-trans isomerase SurA